MEQNKPTFFLMLYLLLSYRSSKEKDLPKIDNNMNALDVHLFQNIFRGNILFYTTNAVFLWLNSVFKFKLYIVYITVTSLCVHICTNVNNLLLIRCHSGFEFTILWFRIVLLVLLNACVCDIVHLYVGFLSVLFI